MEVKFQSIWDCVSDRVKPGIIQATSPCVSLMANITTSRAIPLKMLVVGVTALDVLDHSPAELQFFLDQPPIEFFPYTITCGGLTLPPTRRITKFSGPSTHRIANNFRTTHLQNFFRGVVIPSTNFFNGIALSCEKNLLQGE